MEQDTFSLSSLLATRTTDVKCALYYTIGVGYIYYTTTTLCRLFFTTSLSSIHPEWKEERRGMNEPNPKQLPPRGLFFFSSLSTTTTIHKNRRETLFFFFLLLYYFSVSLIFPPSEESPRCRCIIREKGRA
jgi:hypothetical protein